MDVRELVPSELVAAFDHQLQIGFQSDVMPQFVPWWELDAIENLNLSETGMALIQSMDRDSKLDGNLPRPPQAPIPKLETLMKGSASPTIKWQLLQVL